MQEIKQTSKGEEHQEKEVTLKKETKIHEIILNKKEEFNNTKLTICFVQKEGKGINMKETRKEKVER
jgi:hypothetical protein